MFEFIKRALFKSETLSRDQLKAWISKNIPQENQSYLATVDELLQPPLFDQTEVIKIGGELQRAERTVQEREQDPAMAPVNELKVQLQSVATKLQKLREPIIADFAALRQALQAYSSRTLHQKELIDAYLNKPVETLARDRELAILQVVDSLPTTPELQPIVSSLTSERIGTFLRSYGALVLDQNKIIEQIDSSAAFHSLANARTRVRLSRDQLKAAQDKIDAAKQAEEQRRRALEQELLRQLKEKTGLTLTLA